MNTNGFQGIFQFTGQAEKQNAANPSISGANLEWSWADIEPTEGVYDWSKVDRDINVWTSRGKQVILRFATGGQISWSGSVDGSYTPPWVFNTYGVQRVTETNGTVFPVYWNPVYLQKLTDFVNAAAARYDTNPYVAAVQIGIGQGGETEPDGSASQNPHQLQLWQRYGYTNALCGRRSSVSSRSTKVPGNTRRSR
jgi:beta-galactosidase GanA